MAIDRVCCCALTSKELEACPGVMVNNENKTNLEADATTAVSDVAKALQSLVGENQSNTKLDKNYAAASFLVITHSDSERFAPLYVDTVEHLFPALQATLRQRPQGKSSVSNTPNGTEAAEHQKNGWHPYLLAGCLGALEFFVSRSSLAAGSLTAQSWPAFLERVAAKLPRVSIEATVSGNLPLGAGLSSSSALVVSVNAAVLTALGCSATSKEVAEASARAERYVGVEGGGMDQACICMSRSGFASLTSFHPLEVEYLKLPECCTLALGYCGADSRKIQDSHKKYNLRVLECRLAALLLMRAKSVLHSSREILQPLNLSYVQKTFLGSLEDAGRLVDSVLHDEAYEKAELNELLGGFIKQLLKELPALSGAWEKNNEFKLKQRARHVFSEAIRVHQFADVCRRSHSDDGKLNEFGRLANASHLSCKNDFECSSEKLDAFVSSARMHGAVGSRLTGAGWGGFTVSFLPKGSEQLFEEKASFTDHCFV
ncbi:hypothetical protein Esti_006509 [Eimeria stiedai]